MDDYESEYEPDKHGERQGIICSPCPVCGSEVWFVFVYDWPSYLGGEYLYDCAQCSKCDAEWLTSEAPREFFTEDDKHWKVKGTTC